MHDYYSMTYSLTHSSVRDYSFMFSMQVEDIIVHMNAQCYTLHLRSTCWSLCNLGIDLYLIGMWWGVGLKTDTKNTYFKKKLHYMLQYMPSNLGLMVDMNGTPL